MGRGLRPSDVQSFQHPAPGLLAGHPHPGRSCFPRLGAPRGTPAGLFAIFHQETDLEEIEAPRGKGRPRLPHICLDFLLQMLRNCSSPGRAGAYLRPIPRGNRLSRQNKGKTRRCSAGKGSWRGC